MVLDTASIVVTLDKAMKIDHTGEKMNQNEIQNKLVQHAQWLANNGGERANLRCANLRCANLRYANLRYADLRSADLRSADLQSANLQSANLLDANLQGADLQGADLQGADLRSADLRSADLRSADLQSANLQSVDLQSADLRSADLQDTCLDPNNIPCCNDDNWEIEQTRSGQMWVRGYRTRYSTHVGLTKYEYGQQYEASIFSTSPTECHPGLYLWPDRESAEKWLRDYRGGEIIEVWTWQNEIHKAGNKYRCRWFIVG